MEGLIKAITSLLQAAHTSIGTVAVLFLMTFVLAGLYIIGKNFEHIMKFFPTPDDERGKFQRTLDAQTQIKKLLRTKLENLNADRVGVLQFHNGMVDLTGLGFMHASLSYLEMAPGVGVEPGVVSSPMPMSLFTEVLERMWRDRTYPVPVMVDINQVESTLLKLKMETNGTAVTYWAPLTNLLDQPVGILFASYRNKGTHRPTDSVILTRLAASAAKVTGYLEAVHRPKKRWWQRKA